MTRISGITPSGHVQLGNYLGAVRWWAADGGPADLYFVGDLHAMTTQHNPARLRSLTRELFAVLLAAGIDADLVCVQSDLIAELASLTWVLECVCTFGEARRMTQFKDKSAGAESVRLSLLTYPVLMAADILLSGADEVPVGEDQSQHVQLARALARRFNGTYGDVFTVPEPVLPPSAARIRDLAHPTRKMAKSAHDSGGVVFLLDPPDLVRRKVSRAVTDSSGDVAYAPDTRPGVANLLEILAACTGTTPQQAAAGVSGYATLKERVTDAVIAELTPIRERTTALLADPAELDRVRKAGADRARQRARPRLAAALRLSGLA
jgi:tryptophanyl-tRNA synthetase